MPRHVSMLVAGLSLCSALACQRPADPASDPTTPRSAPDSAMAAGPANRGTPAADGAPTALPTGSCDELEKAFDAGARELSRVCESKDDCGLLWSEFNCYALRSEDDDVAKLEAIDAAMRAQGCSQVECEPPPMIACEDGKCDWDL